VISVISAIVGGSLLLAAANAQSTPTAAAVLRVVPPSDSVTTSRDQADIAINVEQVTDLASFQFTLAFDPAVFKPLAVRKTLFLGQTGREIVCGEPKIEDAAVQLACVTLRDKPAGVDGSGTIATVTLKPAAKGVSDLTLSNAKLARPDGTEIPSIVANARFEVTGAPWWTARRILLIAGGVMALAVAVAAGVVWRVRAQRRLAPPNPEYPPIGSGVGGTGTHDGPTSNRAGSEPDPYEVLGIRPDAPLDVAEAAYRARAKKAHPDAGGRDDEMRELNAAIESIRAKRA